MTQTEQTEQIVWHEYYDDKRKMGLCPFHGERPEKDKKYLVYSRPDVYMATLNDFDQFIHDDQDKEPVGWVTHYAKAPKGPERMER
jgi:hypothetical protein